MSTSKTLSKTLLFALTIGISSLCCADDSESQEEARSLLSGYFANMEAIGSFDVLMDMDLQWVGENGAIQEFKSRERLIVDQEKKRCVSVRDLTRQQYVTSEQGAVEQKDHALRVVVCDGNQAFGRDFPSPIHPLKGTDLVNVLQENDSTVVHSVGTSDFPRSYRSRSTLDKYIDFVRYGDSEIDLLTGLADHPTVRLVLPYPNGVTEEVSCVFDETTLVPLTLRKTYNYQGKTSETFREHFQFKDLVGVFVPMTIEGERRRARTIDGNRISGTDIYDVKFTWFSVNEDLDDEQFSQELVRDANAALAFVSDRQMDTK